MAEQRLRPNPSWKRLELPADWPATLTVVVDTEEEFDWNAPFDSRSRSTANILCQPLAQEILDRYGAVPTYVVDYPVADTPEAAAVLRSMAEAGRCDIGAHLHPWVCPPHEEQVDDFHSFPGNLDPRLERAKLERLVTRIEQAFGKRPTIYKAGRYGIGAATFPILRELGLRTDVSIVPHTDFSDRLGPDFRGFPYYPFRTDDGLVALPLSVDFVGALAGAGEQLYPRLTGGAGARLHLPGIAARLGLLERVRLSPEGHSLSDLVRLTRAALARGERYFMLTYHSSTLLPGANTYVRDEAERAQFLGLLDKYLHFFTADCGGQAKSVDKIASALTQASP